jgi:hypothetical protein
MQVVQVVVVVVVLLTPVVLQGVGHQGQVTITTTTLVIQGGFIMRSAIPNGQRVAVERVWLEIPPPLRLPRTVVLAVPVSNAPCRVSVRLLRQALHTEHITGAVVVVVVEESIHIVVVGWVVAVAVVLVVVERVLGVLVGSTWVAMPPTMLRRVYIIRTMGVRVVRIPVVVVGEVDFQI